MTDQLPWCDCKVAYGVDDIALLEKWMNKTAYGKDILPTGWSLTEIDGAGARYVAVFRVEGPLLVEDGKTVSKTVPGLTA